MSIRTCLHALACALSIGCGVGPKPTIAEVAESVDMTTWASDDKRAVLRSSPANRFRFITRPTQASWKSFVYEDVPLVVPSKAHAKLSFTIPDPSDNELRVTGDWVAVLEGNGGLAYTQGQSTSTLRVSERGAQKRTRTVCRDRMRSDSMRALSIGTFSENSVDFAHFDPVWDANGGCEGAATATLEARATALLPGVLYAFRMCRSGCSKDDSERVEELTVIGPSSLWTVRTVEPKAMTERPGGPFSLTSVELRRGSSASLFLHVGWRELAYFIGLHGKPPYWADAASNATGQVLSIAVDVVWPEMGPAEALVYTSEVTPDAAVLLNASSERP